MVNYNNNNATIVNNPIANNISSISNNKPSVK